MSDFLKDLGQNARTENEVKRDRENKARSQEVKTASRLVESIVRNIKNEISELAQTGKFTTTNGKRTITGAFEGGSGSAIWTSNVFKRLIGKEAAIKVFAGICTCGIYALFSSFGEMAEDDDMVYSGNVRLSSVTEMVIQDTKKALATEGIQISSVEIGQKPFWNAVLNPAEEIPFKRKDIRYFKRNYKKGKTIDFKIKFTYTVTF